LVDLGTDRVSNANTRTARSNPGVGRYVSHIGRPLCSADATIDYASSKMTETDALHLFQAFGVELEYMVVDADSLDVRPVVDELFRAVAGEITSDVEHDDISWSNELVAHVVELKTTEPVTSLVGPAVPAGNRLASPSRPAQPALQFQRHVERVNSALVPLGARLMPSAMHPWMDPAREMKLWPHENGPVYEAFHRIFDCRGMAGQICKAST
jgi:hypothetical protein